MQPTTPHRPQEEKALPRRPGRRKHDDDLRSQLPYGAVATLLGSLFAIEFIVLAIAPASRATWFAENLLVFCLAAALFASYPAFRFSRVSYTLMFLFLSLHQIGAHYTYSAVPYDAWCERAFGFSIDAALGLERNHYDRVVHFAYGLLMAYPIREVFLRVVDVRGFWGYFLPLDLAMSSSMVFELIEWLVADLFGGDLGHEYLGTQGDVWDAHKDMALASLGAVVAMTTTLLFNRAWQRDFAAEWAQSFRVKHPDPLGEDAVARMLETTETNGD